MTLSTQLNLMAMHNRQLNESLVVLGMGFTDKEGGDYWASASPRIFGKKIQSQK
jgi:hypothetical protein